jgi:large subunit ribosomal protein L23
MDLTIYDIIRGPVLTEKASKIINKLNKVVLKVHQKANKPMIKEALEKLFNVKVENVRVINRKGKKRSFKRIEAVGSTEKRAIITLKEGYSLTMAGTGAPVETTMPSESK